MFKHTKYTIMELKAITSITSTAILEIKTIYPKNNLKEEAILMIMRRFMELYPDQDATNMLQMPGLKNRELKVLNLDQGKPILINLSKQAKNKRNQHLGTIN